MSEAHKSAEAKIKHDKELAQAKERLTLFNQNVLNSCETIDTAIAALENSHALSEPDILKHVQSISIQLMLFYNHIPQIEKIPLSLTDEEFNSDHYYARIHANIYFLIARSKSKRIVGLGNMNESLDILLESINREIARLDTDESLSNKENLKAALLIERELLQQKLTEVTSKASEVKFSPNVALTSFDSLLANAQMINFRSMLQSLRKSTDKKSEIPPPKNPAISLLLGEPGTDSFIDLDPAQDLCPSLSKNEKERIKKENTRLSNKLSIASPTEKIVYTLKIAANYIKLGKHASAMPLLIKTLVDFENRVHSLDKKDLLQIWGFIYCQRLLGHCYESEKRYGNAEDNKDNAYGCYTAAIKLLAKISLDDDKRFVPSSMHLDKIKAIFTLGLKRIKSPPKLPTPATPVIPPKRKSRKEKYQIKDSSKKQDLPSSNASDDAGEKDSHAAEETKKAASPVPEKKKGPEPVIMQQEPHAPQSSSRLIMQNLKPTAAQFSQPQRRPRASQLPASHFTGRKSSDAPQYQHGLARPFGRSNLRSLSSRSHDDQPSLNDPSHWPTLPTKSSASSPQQPSEPPKVISTPPASLPQPLKPSSLAEAAPTPAALPIVVTPVLPVVEPPVSQTPSLPEEKAPQSMAAPNPAITNSSSPPTPASSEPSIVLPIQPPLSAALTLTAPVSPDEIKMLCREIEEADQALKYATAVHDPQQQANALELMRDTNASLSAFLAILPARDCSLLRNFSYNGFGFKSGEGLYRTQQQITRKEDLTAQLSLVRDYFATKVAQLRSSQSNRWRLPASPALSSQNQPPPARGRGRAVFMPNPLSPSQPVVIARAQNPSVRRIR